VTDAGCAKDGMSHNDARRMEVEAASDEMSWHASCNVKPCSAGSGPRTVDRQIDNVFCRNPDS
jgi:hypothetical protein